MNELKHKCDKLERQVMQLQKIISRLTNNMMFCTGCEKLISTESGKFLSTARCCGIC